MFIFNFLNYLNQLFDNYSPKTRMILSGIIIFLILFFALNIISIILSFHDCLICRIIINILSYIILIFNSIYTWIVTIILFILELITGVEIDILNKVKNNKKPINEIIDDYSGNVAVLFDKSSEDINYTLIDINEEDFDEKIKEFSYIVVLTKNDDTAKNNEIINKVINEDKLIISIPTNTIMEGAFNDECKSR